ncbi:MAG: phosphotransferase [Pseudomonadota bacterium]
MTTDQQLLIELAEQELDTRVAHATAMRAHASARRIYRLTLEGGATVVGIINEELDENRAFIGFSNAFHSIGLSVPEILADNGSTAYLESDLGDETLMDRLVSTRQEQTIPAETVALYRKSIDGLIRFQLEGLQTIDTALCYQGALFSKDAVSKDVDYFCTEFLTRIDLWSDTDDLSGDIEELEEYCDAFERGFFMFRDFQSRNIMICDDEPFFIDYQSGREGPLQYDLASLLFQSKANLPFALREELVDYYLGRLKLHKPVDESHFMRNFSVFVLVRALQNLGAYGKLGLGQGKQYFRDSIPYALRNCAYILDHWPKGLDCFQLRAKIRRAIDSDR